MRYIWTIMWAFLLSLMAAYVVSNMSGGSFEFSQVIVTTILFTLAAIILGEGVISEEA